MTSETNGLAAAIIRRAREEGRDPLTALREAADALEAAREDQR